MPRVSDIGEFGLIERLKALDVVRGIGDDCAVITPPDGRDLVMSADALIEDVHFRHKWTSWRDLGYKSMAVNLSDIAAMGATPHGALVTLGLRADTDADDVMAFYDGAAEVLIPLGAAIVGGDIVASPTATSISVTAYGSIAHGAAALRSGARVGDGVWVTGTLGDSAAGLLLLDGGHADFPALVSRHSRPSSRVEAASSLIVTCAVHAMMDISDGLAGDVGHLCRESGLGVVIDETALPISDDLRAACVRFGWSVQALAIYGGEDYELLFTLASSADPPMIGVPVTRIGVVQAEPGVRLRDADGSVTPVTTRAFQHF